MQNKIVPNIWFNTPNGKISSVLDYYKEIFADDFKAGQIIPLGETPSGYSEMCEVTIFEQKYVILTTANEHHPLNDSVSFMINCDGQNEIDKYWDYFTKEGNEVQCGWCIDKFGLRWQVLPKNLAELMSKPNAFKVMMGQKKIVIKDYLK
ncbi:MAG: VOC family protein [Ignavibacteriota bacterium]|nr:VOC family protein [Ignavibacteriota bacterium]